MAKKARTSGSSNRLLNALPSADLALLKPCLEPVSLDFRERLQWASRQVRSVYFIESGIASMIAIGRGERRHAEVAIIGREGMTGLPVVLGIGRSPCDIFMQIEGSAQRIAAEDLCAVLGRSAALRQCLLCYAHAFSVQIAHTALANAQGSVEERLARFLLMVHDRIASNVLVLTHDLLGMMLGARRAGVTTALGQLERAGVVERGRGTITVKNRSGLEACANGLYGVPEAEFDRLFG